MPKSLRLRTIRPGAAMLSAVLSVACLAAGDAVAAPELNYRVGCASADITGPPVGVQMFGFVRPDQITEGIHLRQRSRAVVIADPESDQHVAIAIVDLGSVTFELFRTVLERLAVRFGDRYHAGNVIVAATHTHAAPGGYWHYGANTPIGMPLYGEYFDQIVDGIADSIIAAHESLRPGAVLVAKGIVENAGSQRSAPAYRANPPEERARYDADTDREMTLLKLIGADGPIGTINWFAVHPTSMTYYNKLISGDNKGYAAYAFERQQGTKDDPASGEFVAAFAQSNCGDVTANLNLDNTGPGRDDFESTQIIGQRQLDVALKLFETAAEPLVGPIDQRQAFVDFSQVEVSEHVSGLAGSRTAPSAYGYSFAAGSTEDGGGHPLFREGMTKRNGLIDGLVQRTMSLPPPSKQVRSLHKPKAILVAPGTLNPPAQAQVQSLGLVRIGQLALIVGTPEFTTMSGRRIREAVGHELGDQVQHLVIAGYANGYSGYVTTYEEYQIQQYEGGHTLFGPWTQAAYQQEYVRLARAMADGAGIEPGEPPLDVRGLVTSTPLGTEFDGRPEGANFGDVVTDAEPRYRPGEQVRVAFWTGHPQNGFRTGNTYLTIERREGDRWITVASDADWETKCRWMQPQKGDESGDGDVETEGSADPIEPLAAGPAVHTTAPKSNAAHQVEILWDIPAGATSGTYRIVHFGSYKSEDDGTLQSVVGASRTFEVE